MKKKTIKSFAANKVKEWTDSITEDDVKKMAKENAILTGGAIASMFLDEEINDYDIYFRTQDAALKVAQYYVRVFNNMDNSGSITKAYVGDDSVRLQIPGRIVEGKSEGEDYMPIFASQNAITLSNDVQLIFRFFGEAEEIHENFDFVHCTNYWTSWDEKLHTNKEALESLLSKELIYNSSKYPICALIRTRKFIDRGWTVNAGQYLKMCWQVAELDLHNLDVLEEQLIGVDVAYFKQLIKALQSKKENGDDPRDLGYPYIAKVLDRIF